MGQCLLCVFSALESECLYNDCLLSLHSSWRNHGPMAHGVYSTCMKTWVQIPSMPIQTWAWRCTPVILTLWWLRQTGGSLALVGQQPSCRACDPASRWEAKMTEQDTRCPPPVFTWRHTSLCTCTPTCIHCVNTQTHYKENTGSRQKLI